MNPRLSRAFVLLAATLLLAWRLSYSQRAEGESPREPVFSLHVEIPDVIRPAGEIILETKLSNISQQDIVFSGWCPEWMSYLIEVRDHSGARVAKTPAGENVVCRVPESTTWSPQPVVLHPGQSLIDHLMLDRLFELGQGAEYSVSVSDHYRQSGTVVTSNVVQVLVQPQTSGTNESGDFSISIDLDEKSVPAGWGVPVRIKLKNVSNHIRRWADWEPQANREPDETAAGITVFDDSGESIPPTAKPVADSAYHKEHYPTGDLSITDILPGKTVEFIRIIRSVFDVSKPGTYHVVVSMLDPETNRTVRSNKASFEIASNKEAERSRKIPPFIVTIQRTSLPGFPKDSPFTFLICMSNISDHEIRLDNGITKDMFQFSDEKGNPMPLPEEWHEIQSALRRLPELVAPTESNLWFPVEPRSALCGGTHAEAVFSGALPGVYKIRVGRFDEPDALPGQKLKELPIVQSNWLIVRVP